MNGLVNVSQGVLAAEKPEIPWMERLPNHWRLERAKRLFERMKRPVRQGDEVITAFRDGTVTLRRNRRIEGFTESLKEIGYQGIRKGDLVIHAMDGFAGAIGVSDSDGKSTPVYSVCRPRGDANTRYYAYVLRLMSNRRFIEALARGIRERSTDFRFDAFGTLFLPVPPKLEQDCIAVFLERKLEEIDCYLLTKRRQIELLDEQIAATVRRVTTRGIREVPFKPSGSFWLPQIPAHWCASRIKNEFLCLNSRRIPLSGPERGRMKRREYDYYGASGIIDWVDDYIFDDELLLIAEDGANLVLRNLPLVIVARGKFWVNNHAHILKPKDGSLEFFSNLLEIIDYRPWVTGAAQPKLTKDRLMAVEIPVPPLDEQHAIAGVIRRERERLEPIRQALDREIKLMAEYRTALIAEAVTGRLPVPGTAGGQNDAT